MRMRIAPSFPIQIFYDGACRVCAAEIEHYLRRDHGGRLQGVDISAPDFVAPAGLTHAALMYELHVIDAGGTIYRNIAAFEVIWRAFPGDLFYRFLSTLFALPLFHPLARCGYRIFARLRRYLPKRRTCASGVCRPDSRSQN
jgi:predicted DCC family thiol-disulfide oxidoreductase YuxK